MLRFITYCLAPKLRYLLMSLVAFVSVTALSGCIKEERFTHENTTIVGVGDLAPDFEVELLNGGSLKLSQFKGDVLMLIFFSAGCPDCHAEFAELQKLLSQADPSFHILAISREDSEPEVRDFVEQYGLKFDVGLDRDKSIYGLYATRYVPRCFLIGRDGKVKALTVEYKQSELTSIWDKAMQEGNR